MKMALWNKRRGAARRIQIEDALKHLYDCEERKTACTRQSLAGALGVPSEQSAQVLEQLADMNLAVLQEHGYALTGEGRSYALRVIRTHRIWERYLADETGMGETEWHEDAEHREHELTRAETDALASRMGNPRYDPHGDPIPTEAGDLPVRTGIPLNRLAPGDVAGIIHIEDEPAAVYAQLVAQNLHPGLRLRVLEQTREKIRFEIDGVEIVLAPVVAANVTVVPLENLAVPVGPSKTLADLRDGETGRVVALSRRCRGAQRRRLLDLGLVPGTLVEAGMTSAWGDPTAYVVRGATIALRRTHAALIRIEKEKRREEWKG